MLTRPRRTQSEVAAMKKRILSALKAGPIGRRSLSQALHVGDKALERWLEQLKGVGLIDCFGNGGSTRWALKPVADAENARIEESRRLRDDREAARRAKRQARREEIERELEAEIERGLEREVLPVRRVIAKPGEWSAHKPGPASIWEYRP